MVATLVEDLGKNAFSINIQFAQLCNGKTNQVSCQHHWKPEKISRTVTAPLHVLQSHDCLRSGPPDVGELIVVAMPNGQVVNASYVKSHTHIYYQVSSTPAAVVVERRLFAT